ncbi:Glucose-6-phosphate isomerase [Dirofilaria immitis]
MVDFFDFEICWKKFGRNIFQLHQEYFSQEAEDGIRHSISKVSLAEANEKHFLKMLKIIAKCSKLIHNSTRNSKEIKPF